MLEYLSNLQQAIECERTHEEKTYAQLLLKHNIFQRTQMGLAWFPAQILKRYYTSGERVEIHLSCEKATRQHRFKVGIGVNFFSVLSGVQTNFSASVSFVRGNEMRLILNDHNLDLDEISERGQFGVEMVYDEKPYRVMIDTIKTIKELKNGPVYEMAQGIATDSDFEVESEGEYHMPLPDYLNDSQKNAIVQISKAGRVGLIQGPPGTGKTTTVVELIRYIASSDKRILVCAPSNNAVDLLATKINERGIPVVRIGNITKVDDANLSITLDEVVRNHNDWDHIKKVKIEAEKLDQEARKFKRTFGAEERNERKILKKEAWELRKWARVLEQKLTSHVLYSTKVIACTLIGAKTLVDEGLLFDTLVIDEASQALDPECLTAMLCAKRVIFVGDQKQLPPTIKTQEAKKFGFEQTILDRLIHKAKFSFFLDTQYRMNEAIVAWPNANFYNGRLKSFETIANRTLAHLPKILFIDMAGTGYEEQFNHEHQSFSNEGDFLVIKEFINRHHEVLLGATIGVISPYSQQVRYITKQISLDHQAFLNLDVDIDSIDGFQGQEKDLILISLVRSNEKGLIGFLEDQRRLNVALTRAKKCLVVVGDSATIGNNPLYSQLLNHFESQEAYGSAWEYLY